MNDKNKNFINHRMMIYVILYFSLLVPVIYLRFSEYIGDNNVIFFKWLFEKKQLVSIAVVSMLAFILLKIFDSINNEKYTLLKKNVLYSFLLLSSLFLLYQDFFVSDKVMIFNDIAGDSVAQTYPTLIHNSFRIVTGIWGEFCDFSQGLGNVAAPLTLEPGNWFCIFGRSNIPLWIGISAFFRNYIAGIFAYMWAKEIKDDYLFSIIMGLGYAFSCEFMIRGAWYSYPTLFLWLIVWLFSFELFITNKSRILMPIATILFFYSTSVLSSILWIGLLGAYIIFRLNICDNCLNTHKLKKIVRVETVFGIFAILVSGNTIFTNIKGVLQSNRYESAKNSLQLSIETFFTPTKTVLTGFLRTIGQNITGISSDYTGAWNYLEDMTFYCGILVLLLVPISIYNVKKEKRSFFLILTISAILFITINPVMWIVSGFSFCYKTCSQWIVIYMMITALEFVAKIAEEDKLRRGSIVVLDCTTLITVSLILISLKLDIISRLDNTIASVVFVLLYTVLLHIFFSRTEKRELVKFIICSAVVIEVLCVSWRSINDRGVLSTTDSEEDIFIASRVPEVLSELEDNSWYRIEKSTFTVSQCDSLAENFYGTVSYIGGTEADKSIINCYDNYELYGSVSRPVVNSRDVGHHWLNGTGNNIYAKALLSVKYYISKGEWSPLYQWDEYCSVGDMVVYKNNWALPLLYVYDSFADSSVVEEVSANELSRNVLLHAVVDKDIVNENIKEEEWEYYNIDENNRIFPKKDGATYRFDSGTLGSENILVIQLGLDDILDGCPITWYDSDMMEYSELLYCKAQKKYVEIECDNLTSLTLSESAINSIKSIDFYSVSKEELYMAVDSSVKKLQNNAVDIVYHDLIYNDIVGEVASDDCGILASSIPFSNKWKIEIDGKLTETFVVNTAFVGCYIPAGEHTIRVFFDGDSWIEQNYLKLLAVLLVVIYAGYLRFANNIDKGKVNSK